MTDESSRDHPFRHLTDDELQAAHAKADDRYCKIVGEDESPSDRASVIDWIVRSGEESVIQRAYFDEWRRRGKC
jgi:hypothetical protein